MDNCKFTKGKWRYSSEHECITTSRLGIVEGSKTICEIKQAPSFDYSGNEAKANALLISKAPKMLEMLIEMSQAVKWYHENCIPSENTKNNSEIFFNMGANLIEQSDLLIKEATEL